MPTFSWFSARRRGNGFPAALLTIILTNCAAADAGTTPVVGLPCEDCEVASIGLPAHPPAMSRLALEDEPGERLLLTGKVTDAQGKPRSGVVVYAHQTNQRGIYPGEREDVDAGIRRHGRLRGWASTDAEGMYTFNTIRPGSYPRTRVPQHIHLYVIERGCALYYIDDVLFRDDPHLTSGVERKASQGRGGNGVVVPVRHGDGWHARRDIVLGKNIPGYPRCA